jgi:DNA-binding transcriptional regulator GbsR (MarR family)
MLDVFQESLAIIAKDKDLKGYTLRVFFVLLSQVSVENYICISHSEIGKITAIDRSNVTKAIGKLVEKQIIFKSEGKGNVNAYKLNPNIAWKGDVAKFEKEKKRYPRLRQRTIPELINELDQHRDSKNKHDSK